MEIENEIVQDESDIQDKHKTAASLIGQTNNINDHDQADTNKEESIIILNTSSRELSDDLEDCVHVGEEILDDDEMRTDKYEITSQFLALNDDNSDFDLGGDVQLILDFTNMIKCIDGLASVASYNIFGGVRFHIEFGLDIYLMSGFVTSHGIFLFMEIFNNSQSLFVFLEKNGTTKNIHTYNYNQLIDQDFKCYLRRLKDDNILMNMYDQYGDYISKNFKIHLNKAGKMLKHTDIEVNIGKDNNLSSYTAIDNTKTPAPKQTKVNRKATINLVDPDISLQTTRRSTRPKVNVTKIDLNPSNDKYFYNSKSQSNKKEKNSTTKTNTKNISINDCSSDASDEYDDYQELKLAKPKRKTPSKTVIKTVIQKQDSKRSINTVKQKTTSISSENDIDIITKKVASKSYENFKDSTTSKSLSKNTRVNVNSKGKEVLINKTFVEDDYDENIIEVTENNDISNSSMRNSNVHVPDNESKNSKSANNSKSLSNSNYKKNEENFYDYDNYNYRNSNSFGRFSRRSRDRFDNDYPDYRDHKKFRYDRGEDHRSQYYDHDHGQYNDSDLKNGRSRIRDNDRQDDKVKRKDLDLKNCDRSRYAHGDGNNEKYYNNRFNHDADHDERYSNQSRDDRNYNNNHISIKNSNNSNRIRRGQEDSHYGLHHKYRSRDRSDSSSSSEYESCSDHDTARNRNICTNNNDNNLDNHRIIHSKSCSCRICLPIQHFTKKNQSSCKREKLGIFCKCKICKKLLMQYQQMNKLDNANNVNLQNQDQVGTRNQIYNNQLSSTSASSLFLLKLPL